MRTHSRLILGTTLVVALFLFGMASSEGAAAPESTAVQPRQGDTLEAMYQITFPELDGQNPEVQALIRMDGTLCDSVPQYCLIPLPNRLVLLFSVLSELEKAAEATGESVITLGGQPWKTWVLLAGIAVSEQEFMQAEQEASEEDRAAMRAERKRVMPRGYPPPAAEQMLREMAKILPSSENQH